MGKCFAPTQTALSNQKVSAPSKPVIGMVSTHATKICPATPQRTLLLRSAAPAPTIVELMTCVVLTGPPSKAAPKITTVPAIWEEKACIGRIL